MRFMATTRLIYTLSLLILLCVFPNYNQTHDPYTECIKLNSMYKELNLKCEKFLSKDNEVNVNTNIPVPMHQAEIEKPELAQNIPAAKTEIQRNGNNLLLSSFNMYKRNMLELYDIYKGNEDYKGFIKVMGKTLTDKAQNATKTNFRFSQANLSSDSVDYDSFFSADKRKEISKQFVDNISSENLRKEVNSQYKTYQDSDMKGLYKKETEFFTSEDNYAKSDKKAVDLSTKLYGSLSTMGDKYKDQRPTGILTVDGQIANDPVKYIKQEETKLKSSYKDGNNYSYDDVKKLMKLEDYGNEATMKGK